MPSKPNRERQISFVETQRAGECMTACNYCMQDDHTVRLAKARPCLTCINPPEHQSLSVVEDQDCTTLIALASRSSCGVLSASSRPRGLPSLGGLLGRSARFRCGQKAQVSCHVLLSEPTWSQFRRVAALGIAYRASESRERECGQAGPILPQNPGQP